MGREIYNLNVQSDSIRDKVFNFFLKVFGYTSYCFWLHVLLFYMCVYLRVVLSNDPAFNKWLW